MRQSLIRLYQSHIKAIAQLNPGCLPASAIGRQLGKPTNRQRLLHQVGLCCLAGSVGQPLLITVRTARDKWYRQQHT